MPRRTQGAESPAAEDDHSPLIPIWLTGATAMLCGLALIIMAALGPLGTGDIQYRTSESGLWQLQGQDLASLALIAPLLLLGGALLLAKRPGAKYLLILVPITLIYTGLSIGVGQEWGNPAYTGNVEQYFWIFLTLIIGGVLLLVGVLPMFSTRDAPSFRPKGLRAFVGLTALAITMFALMWIGQIMEVLGTGDLVDGSYSEAPTLFWTIRYMDLGIVVPLGFLALYLLMTRPARAYPLVLLFFGFFITMAVCVNAMALMMAINSPTGLADQGPMVAIFPVLGILSFVGLLYLVRHKLGSGHANP